MRPISFNGCFGWLHEGSGSIGTVICNAIGGESLLRHREMLQLANSLASSGIPALRFDYPNTGDSLDIEAKCQTTVWSDAIANAVDWMRTQMGVSAVVLIGYRFGGALATLAAIQLRDVAALVLLAPVLSGRLYSRELRVQAELERAIEDADAGERRFRRKSEKASAAVEAGGFFYTDEILTQFQRINLLEIQIRPAPHVLIYSRNIDRFSNVPFFERLRKLGADVCIGDGSTHADDMMYSTAAFSFIARWLKGMLPCQNRPVQLFSEPVAGLAGPEFAEEPVLFGDRSTLAGVLCRPISCQQDRPTVLFLTSWPVSHIGHGRMWVTMARAFARLGVASFRFDIAGTGDSLDRPDRLRTAERPELAVEDVQNALGWLQDHGHRQFIIIGFCWGSSLAAAVSHGDERISGQVLIYFPIEVETAATCAAMARKHLATITSQHWWSDYASASDFLKIIGWTVRRINRIISLLLRSRLLGICPRVSKAALYTSLDDALAFGTKTLLIYSDKDDWVGELDSFLTLRPSANSQIAVVRGAIRGDRFFLQSYRETLTKLIGDYVVQRASCLNAKPPDHSKPGFSRRIGLAE